MVVASGPWVRHRATPSDGEHADDLPPKQILVVGVR
jgi:hypothetical protein